MSIAHRHHDRAVTEYLLQYQNVTTAHHEVTGKCMAQNVSPLSLW